MVQQSPNIPRGVALILATTLTISIQDVVFKQVSAQIPLWQIFALRGLLAVPLVFLIIRFQANVLDTIRLAYSRWPVIRSLLILITFVSFYSTIPFLSLATIGAAIYVSPIVVTVLSALLLKETIGIAGWCGVWIGFLGVVLLLQPGSDVFSFWAALPLGGAVFYALAHIITRTKCHAVPMLSMSLSLNSVLLLAGIIVGGLLWLSSGAVYTEPTSVYLFGLWAPVEVGEWFVLSMLAVFAVLSGMLLAGAYQAAPASIISTFEYTYLLFVLLLDFIVFDAIPTPPSLLGMVLIVLAGVLVLKRDTVQIA